MTKFVVFMNSSDMDVSYGIDETTALLGVFDSIEVAKASVEAEHGELNWDNDNTASKEVMEEYQLTEHKVLKSYSIVPVELNKTMDLCIASAFYLE
jgi:hypothetical protein